MTPSAMSRPTAAQLSNSSEGLGKPVAGRAVAIGWPAWAGAASRGAWRGAEATAALPAVLPVLRRASASCWSRRVFSMTGAAVGSASSAAFSTDVW